MERAACPLVGRTLAILLLITLVRLVLVADARAAPTQRADPPHAWWKAAEMALDRGDCKAAIALLEAKLDEGESGAAIPLGDIHDIKTA